jgi:hypothetical protein
MTQDNRSLKIKFFLDNLLLSVITGSKKTADTIDKLPKFELSRNFLIWQV